MRASGSARSRGSDDSIKTQSLPFHLSIFFSIGLVHMLTPEVPFYSIFATHNLADEEILCTKLLKIV